MKNIWHIMARAKKSCLTLTISLDTLSNYHWTHCPIIIGQIVQWHLVCQILVNWICPGQCVQNIQNFIYCPMIIGLIAQILLDTLSNQYWTQCPMIISHIDQCLLDKFQINIGQNIGQLNLPWTIRPRYTRFDILSNDLWTHYPMTIYYTESITLYH